MKRVTALILAVVMVFSTLSISGSYETRVEASERVTVLSNNFDSDTEGWQGRGATVVHNSTEGYDSPGSIYVSERTANWAGGQYDALNLLETGTEVEISLWVKHTTDTAIQMTLAVENTVSDTTNYTWVNNNDAVQADTWTLMEGSFLVESADDFTKALIYVEAADPDVSYYLDDVKISKVASDSDTTVSTPEVVTDAALSILLTHDFEEDQNGWVGRGDALAAVSDLEAQEGSQSLHVTERTANWQGAQVDALSFLDLNTDYELSTYVWFDGADGATDTFKLSVQKVIDGTMGWDTVSEVVATANTWTELKGSYKLTTEGEVTEYTIYVEAADLSHDYYVDYFTVGGNWSGQSFDFEDGIQGFQPRIGEEVLTSEAPGKSGEKSLKVAERAFNYSGAKYDLLNKMQVGATYTVEAWLYQTSGTDQSISLTMEKSAGSTAYDYITGGTIPSDTWTKISGEYSLSATTDITALSVYFEATEPSLDFYVDDMSIALVDDSEPLAIQTDIPSVKDIYTGKFSIGAAVSDSIFSTQVMQDVTNKHFSSITAENSMKPETMLPENNRGSIDFTMADQYEAYATDHGIGLRGHTLVWHSQTPDWFFTENYEDLEEDHSNLASREVMLERMENYVKTVTQRYNDSSVYAWDVVNEAIDTSQADNMRRSLWYETVGPDFVEKAFGFARTYSDAKLFYNDYGVNESNKRAAIAALVAGLQDKGLIDGVGIQSHINIDTPTVAGFETTIEVFEAMGLEIQLTELDMDIYGNDSLSFSSISEEILVRQGYKYKALFEMFEAHSDSITNITFWGVTDKASWLNSFPVNRKNWPLLFDENYQVKYAYWGIVDPSRLPILTNVYGAREATIDLSVKESLSDRIQTSLVIAKDGGQAGELKLHWDQDTLYMTAVINDDVVNSEDSLTLAYVDGSIKTVEIYRDGRLELDGRNIGHEGNERNMKLYPNGPVTLKARIADEGDVYRLYAAIPMADLENSQTMAMDFIVVDGSSHNHWNDVTGSMPLVDANFGSVTLLKGIQHTEARRGTPVIDGAVDTTWQYANKVLVDQFTEGSEGASGSAYTMWDKDFLYVLINVVDTNLSKVSVNPWEQDSVEIFIDENNNRTTDYEVDDVQYRVNFDNEVTIGGGPSESGFVSATSLTDTGYIVELAIPYNLEEKKQGDLIGFDVQINDDNGAGTRTSVVNWNDLSGSGWRNTTEFGALLFINTKAKATTSSSSKDKHTNDDEEEVAVSSELPSKTVTVERFKDVSPKAWYFSGIDLMRSKGIFNGYPDGSFKPEKAMSRGEVAKVLVKVLNLEASDVPTSEGDAWYATYGGIMSSLGLMESDTEGNFDGDIEITREEMAVILYKSRSYLTLVAFDRPTTFIDESAISEKALEAVRYMAEYGIFQGDEEGRFMPSRILKRSEIAIIIERLIVE